MNNRIKILLSPMRKPYYWCLEKRNLFLGIVNPKKRISELHREINNKDIDWDNPKDINEKISWLKIFSDTNEWTKLADKYRVREFIVERGLSDILVKLYGKWDDAEEIDFDCLPKSFVLKDNHGSGTIIVVKDKAVIDEKSVRKTLNKWLKTRYGVKDGEIHYSKIKPCIIAEELLEDKTLDFTSTLVDYKVWAFKGKPYSIWACYNREHGHAYVSLYDTEWNYHPEYSVFTDHYRDGGNVVPKPKTLQKMLNAASVLSKDFPEVRVDFYEVNGKLYFGEMTFSSAGGHMDFYTQEYLDILGNQVDLSKCKKSVTL